MAAVISFPDSNTEKQFYEEIKNLMPKCDNQSIDIGLIYSAILFRYPLAIIHELPMYLVHDLDIAFNEDQTIDERVKIITEGITCLIENGFFEKKEKINNDNHESEVTLLSPGKSPTNYINYVMKTFNDAITPEIKDQFAKWKEYVTKDYLEYRLREYCHVIPTATSEEGKITFKEDLLNVENYSKIYIMTFSLETIDKGLLKESIFRALKAGIDEYRILFLCPEVGYKLEKLRSKIQIQKGIRELQQYKKELLKIKNNGERVFTRKEIKKIKIRCVNNEKYANLFGLIKVEKSEKRKSVYRIFAKRKKIDRGVTSPIIRGYYRDNSLFEIFYMYTEFVWANSSNVELIDKVKYHWKLLFLIPAIILTSVFYYTLTRDIKDFIISFIILGFVIPFFFDLIMSSLPQSSNNI